MGIPGTPNPLLMRRAAAAAGDDAYQIEKSLRFENGDSASLQRTPSFIGNRRTFTIAYWVKKCRNGAYGEHFAQKSGTPWSTFQFGTSNNCQLNWGAGQNNGYIQTTAVFRDLSAWYHICMVWDTNNEVETDRARIYINGKRQTVTNQGGWPTRPEEMPTGGWNDDEGTQYVGGGGPDGSSDYLSDVHHIDGLALSPAAFGSFDSADNWNPKAFALPAPNNNVTWSNSLAAEHGFYNSGGNSYPATNLFDGLLDTVASDAQAQSYITFTPSGGISYSQSVRVYQKNPDGSDKNDSTFTLTDNDGTVRETKVADNSGKWTTLHEGSGKFTSLKAQANAAADTWNYWAAIEVDGVILVDGKIDPTTRNNPNNGIKWSDGVTGNPADGNGTSGFDGKLTTRLLPTNSNSCTWKPPSTITAEKGIRLYCLTRTLAPNTGFKVNGTDIQSDILAALTNNVAGWFDLNSLSTPITTIDTTNGIYIEKGDAASKNNALYAVEVDGHILVDNASDNSFRLKFNDTSRNSALGKDTLNGAVNKTGAAPSGEGGYPIYNTTDDYGDIKGSGNRTDSLSSSLKFALPGDVVDGDVSSSDHTVTNNSSNVTVTTGQSRFYGSSLDFGAGSNATYLTLPDHADFEFGAGDYCIEAWIRCTSASQANNIWSQRNSSHEGITFQITNARKLEFFNDNDANVHIVSAANLVSLNAWNHVAVSRASGTTKLWLNGTQVASGTDNTDYDGNTPAPRIGANAVVSSEFVSGQMQDIRVYKGAAKYTANFKPPTRNDFGTVNNLTTETGSATVAWAGAKTVTATNGATTTTSNTKFYGTSKELDGSNDYINTQTSTDWNFPGEFTVELWFRPEATTGIRPLIAGRDNNSGWCFSYWAGNDGKLTFFTAEGTSPSNNGTEVQWEPPSLYTNTWVHVAVTRNSSNSVTLWVNGDDKTSSTVTGTLTIESDDPIQIGNVWPSGMDQYDGQFGDIRVYKGVCKYVADFTVPDGSTSVASATGGLPIRNTSGTNGETALSGFRADYIPGTTTDVSSYLVLAIPGNSYEDVSASIRKPGPEALDSLTDSPTNYAPDTGSDGDGGVTRGNYCTWNALSIKNASNQALSLEQGCLYVDSNNDGWGYVKGTMAVNTGKWYFEARVLNDAYSDATGQSNNAIGVLKTTEEPTPNNPNALSVGAWYGGCGWSRFWNSTWTNHSQKLLAGDVIGVAIDCSARSVTFYRNDSQVSTASGLWTAGEFVTPAQVAYYSNYDDLALNFGQRAFKYDPPSTDHKTLCTQNLDDFSSGNSVNNPRYFFDINLYTGAGTGNAKSFSNMKFGPDLIWGKARSYADPHGLCDVVRGVSSLLVPSGEAIPVTTSGSHVTAFASNGYTLGNGVNFNGSSTTYVNWCWDAGTAAATPSTAGSITISNQYVNTTAGFSISKYTMTADGGTFGHALKDSDGNDAVPDCVIVKRINATADYCSWHKGIPNTDYMMINENNGASTWDVWGDTTPTSTLVTVSGDSYTGNNGDTYMAYCWTSIPGYSAFGTYEGNGSSAGPFIYTGFRVRYIITKNIDATANWRITDTDRADVPFANPQDQKLYTDGDWVEGSGDEIWLMSNGFKILDSDAGFNSSGHTFIYMAFAEHPFKTARAR